MPASSWSAWTTARTRSFLREVCVLLALDAGNTNVTIGTFEYGKLTANWRLRTIHEQTADEWGVLLRSLFRLADLDVGKVDGIIVASVVPPIDAALALMARRYFETEARFVTHETDTGFEICYDDPKEDGADRVVNAVAGLHKYGGAFGGGGLGAALSLYG